jgi:hypothetical protein
MKAVETNIANIFIAVGYSIFGVMTFLLLKNAIKYFTWINNA